MALRMRFMEKNVYEKLTRINGNRPFNPTKFHKFLRSIRDNDGKLPETGQWVITVNAKSQIVDGQNHWWAIMLWNEKHPKKAIEKIPYYLIADGDLNTAKALNTGDERWKDPDLISSWSDLGHADFSVLKAILATDNAKKVGRRTVYKICGNPDIENIHKTIVDGSFTMWREQADAESMIAHLADVKSQLLNLYGPEKLVVPLFLACTRIQGIDMNHFCRQLKKPTVSINYSINEKDILDTFTRLYNAGEGCRSRKHINIAAQYQIVMAYNTYQDENKNKDPQMREMIKQALEEANESKEKGRKAGQKKIKEVTHQAEANATMVHQPMVEDNSLQDNGVGPV